MTPEAAQARTLPIRVPILPGESLDSWLEAVAHRNGTTLPALLNELQVPTDGHPRGLVTDLPAPILRRLEACTGLTRRRLDQAVLSVLDSSAARVHGGPETRAVLDGGDRFARLYQRCSRYCPDCLAAGGRWQLSWWLPWSFGCLTHHALLHDACPGCDTRQRTTLSNAIQEPRVCSHRNCRADLGATPRLDLGSDHPILATQQWIITLHDAELTKTGAPASTGPGISARAAPDDPGSSTSVVSDLNACMQWVMRSAVTDSEVRRLGTVIDRGWREGKQLLATRTEKFRPPTAAVRGVVAHIARDLLDTTNPPTIDGHRRHGRGPLDDVDLAAVAAIRESIGRAGGPLAPVPTKMPRADWNRLSQRMQERFLWAADPLMRSTDRIRFRSCTSQPTYLRPDAPQLNAFVAARHRHVPQLLWPGWTVRLMPMAGMQENLFRALTAALLLLPGEPCLNTRGVTNRLHPYLPNSAPGVLRLGIAAAGDDILTAICHLADYLDTYGSAIDYQRRRELVPAEPIAFETWRQMCLDAGEHPGERAVGPNRAPRFIHAQRYLHHVMTGSDLADPAHPLAWKSTSDRARYHAFVAALTPTRRECLHDHASRLLAQCGVDEPLTWEPPSEVAAGLTLPGINPATIDVAAVVRTVLDQQHRPSTAAEQLGLSMTQVRYALQHAPASTSDSQERDCGGGPVERSAHVVSAWQRRQRAGRLLTPEFLHREYIEHARTCTQIAAEHNVPRDMVIQRARALGITVHRTRRPIPIDDDWLRHQYLAAHRSTADIAAELGTKGETIRRRLTRLGVSVRPAGVHSRQIMIAAADHGLPRDVRDAVERTLDGWLRLNRFQVAMAFPSLAAAAAYLNLHQSTLVHQLQRLECDVGTSLYHRSGFGKPQRPTRTGRTLLKHLAADPIRTLLQDTLRERFVPTPGPVTVSAAKASHAIRRPPGPPKPYSAADLGQEDGAAAPTVQRLRIRPETLTLLHDLVSHPTEQTYAAGVSARTGLAPSSVTCRLRQLTESGWLVSSPEDDKSWLGRAPAGCGPGRRRIHYTLTAVGRLAANHELATRGANSGFGLSP